MTKISRASLRSYTTTHLTYRPPDEARRLLHEHANAIILQAGKALAEILPESEASIAALDALGMARMRCNQAIAHDECDLDEGKARIAKADLQCGIAETVQAAADSMVDAIDRIDANPYLTSVLSQSIRSEDPERVFDGMAERMKANAARMKRVSLRDLDYRAADKATRAAVTTPVTNATDTFDVKAFVSSSGARVEHHSISAERLVEWARDNLAKAEHVEEVREWIDRDAWHLRIDGASFTNGHGGHVVVRRNLDGTLPQGKAPADEHRGIYGKYFVRRADGRDDRHCSYFVLRMDDGRKPWDVAALQAYADALPQAYAKLATDIRAIITEIEEEVDAEFAGDLPEGFDRHEALSELAGYGFENGTLLKCSDAELSHLCGQWRRFKAANTKAAEAKVLAGLREIFGKFDMSADEAIESVRILMAERNATDAALSRSIAETPLSNDGTLIERLDRRLQEADSDHRAYRAFVGLHDDVVSACRGLVDACRALGWPDDDATVATPGRGETSTLLAEIGAATAALSKWKDLRTDDHPSWHDFEVTKAERNGLRSLLAEVGALLLGPAGTPTAANVLGEAKALREMVDGDHRLSTAFGQAGRRAEVTAKALSLLKSECEDVDAQIVMLEGLLLGLDTGNPRTREDRVIALVEEAKRIRHLVDGMGCPSKLSDIIAGRAKRANASNKDAFERGRAEGQADVAARLRELLDPSDEHKDNLNGMLVMVGDLLEDAEMMRAAAKGAAIQAAEAAAEARKAAKDQMHEAMEAAKEEKWKAGHANGMEWAWISLRKAIDPTQKSTWTFDQMLGIVGDWRERVDRVQPIIDETAGRPAMVTCPPEGLMVLRSWNGVRLVSSDGSGSAYLCARDGCWEWHDGDEKWRPLSVESNDEQAFADGRKQGIADVREAINAIEVNGTMAGIDQIVPRREDVIRLIDALGGSPPNDGDIIHDEARALSSQSVNVMRSVSALLRSTRQIGKRVVERRALDDAKRNQWIVENKLWEPQEATPVSGSRLRVPNVSVFAEAAPGVPVSVANPAPVMVGTVPTSIVAVNDDDDSTGGEVTIAHHVKWTSDGPVTIRRVIE